MIDGMLDWLVQSLRLGAGGAALGRVLPPAKTAPTMVAMSPLLHRPLVAAGYRVLGPEGIAAGRQDPGPDGICAVVGAADLHTLLPGWARSLRPGGVVALVSLRGAVSRTTLCAALLHAGLGEVLQQGAGAMVITSGRVIGPTDDMCADGSHGERQKTCDQAPAVRIGQGA